MLNSNFSRRTGAVVPLFAFLLPVLFLLSGFAINIAYMQLVSSEMKIASDAAAHAGGRAMSINQNTDSAIELARTIGALNMVGSNSLALTVTDSDDDITFGLSTREGMGRYTFVGYTQADVDAGIERATSFAVEGSADIPLLFVSIPGLSDSITVRRRSIATQVDRDIALVLDRSGSMLYYEDETGLSAALLRLYTEEVEVEVEPAKDGFWEYAWYKWRRGSWRFKGYFSIEEGSSRSGWVRDSNDKRWQEATDPVYEMQTLISQQEYTEATKFLYDRTYTQNVSVQLATISTEMSEYAADWQTMLGSSSSWWTRSPAPRHSRWAKLNEGVDAFLEVLESTDQEELVSLVFFNSTANLTLELNASYDGIRNAVAEMVPYHGTAIGDGMTIGHPELVGGTNARIFASKTIVVLTDGENNNGVDPVTAAENIVNDDAVTIHTVTFATDNQSAKAAMEAVATTGFGRHYHADTGEELIATFREIANNLPTILTE